MSQARVSLFKKFKQFLKWSHVKSADKIIAKGKTQYIKKKEEFTEQELLGMYKRRIMRKDRAYMEKQ